MLAKSNQNCDISAMQYLHAKNHDFAINKKAPLDAVECLG